MSVEAELFAEPTKFTTVKNGDTEIQVRRSDTLLSEVDVLYDAAWDAALMSIELDPEQAKLYPGLSAADPNEITRRIDGVFDAANYNQSRALFILYGAARNAARFADVQAVEVDPVCWAVEDAERNAVKESTPLSLPRSIFELDESIAKIELLLEDYLPHLGNGGY